MARHSRPFPWFNEEEEQHGRKRDNERRANHRRVSYAERVREDVLEGVDPPTKKGHDEEAPKVRTSPPRTTRDLEGRKPEA